MINVPKTCANQYMLLSISAAVQKLLSVWSHFFEVIGYTG